MVCSYRKPFVDTRIYIPVRWYMINVAEIYCISLRRYVVNDIGIYCIPVRCYLMIDTEVFCIPIRRYLIINTETYCIPIRRYPITDSETFRIPISWYRMNDTGTYCIPISWYRMCAYQCFNIRQMGTVWDVDSEIGCEKNCTDWNDIDWNVCRRTGIQTLGFRVRVCKCYRIRITENYIEGADLWEHTGF